MWDLDFLIHEAATALSGRMVCIVQASELCQICNFLSMKHSLR